MAEISAHIKLDEVTTYSSRLEKVLFVADTDVRAKTTYKVRVDFEREKPDLKANIQFEYCDPSGYSAYLKLGSTSENIAPKDLHWKEQAPRPDYNFNIKFRRIKK